MTLWVIGDVHGYNELLQKLLSYILGKKSPGDKIIFLGDLIDRGPDSLQVIETIFFLRNLYGEDIITIWGNHEDIACAALGIPSACGFSQEMAERTWLSNGGLDVLKSYLENKEALTKDLIELTSKYKLIHQENYEELPLIFVHAGLPTKITTQDVLDYKLEVNEWTGYSQFSVPSLLEKILWLRPQSYDKFDNSRIVVCGHTPGKTVVNYPNFICIDVGSFYSGKLAAVELKTEDINHRVFITASEKGITYDC